MILSTAIAVFAGLIVSSATIIWIFAVWLNRPVTHAVYVPKAAPTSDVPLALDTMWTKPPPPSWAPYNSRGEKQQAQAWELVREHYKIGSTFYMLGVQMLVVNSRPWCEDEDEYFLTCLYECKGRIHKIVMYNNRAEYLLWRLVIPMPPLDELPAAAGVKAA